MAKAADKLNALRAEICELEDAHSKALKGKGGNPDTCVCARACVFVGGGRARGVGWGWIQRVGLFEGPSECCVCTRCDALRQNTPPTRMRTRTPAHTRARTRITTRRSLASRVSKKMAALHKAELAVAVKEDLKTVALGTSKINYMDPRITIAWCKRNEVPHGRAVGGLGGPVGWHASHASHGHDNGRGGRVLASARACRPTRTSLRSRRCPLKRCSTRACSTSSTGAWAWRARSASEGADAHARLSRVPCVPCVSRAACAGVAPADTQ
jgi:hypothetical protein